MPSLLSDADRFRKSIAGVALIAAPLAGFLSCLPDSTEGTGDNGVILYTDLKAHAAGIHASGLIFMLSAIFTVPTALGLAHLLRNRGALLGNLGATALTLGAFGHFGYGLWQLTLSNTNLAGSPSTIVAGLDRTSSTGNMLLPLLLAVDLGIVLLSAGLLRARVVPSWAPWTTLAAIAADFAMQFAGTQANWPTTTVWAVLTITFGYLGVHILAMTPQEWANHYSTPTIRQPELASTGPN